MANQIGTAPNQIPVNGMLGGMAFQVPNAVNITGGKIGGSDVNALALKIGIPKTTGNAYKHLRVNSAADGAEWVDRPLSNVQVFTSTGTFTPPSGVTEFFVILTGGGGGANGGGGGYVFGMLSISSAQTVTIGAGGSSGVNGGNSSIGSLATANGGTAGVTNYGGSGGSATCADSGCIAVAGDNGLATYNYGVNGTGASFFGRFGPGGETKNGIAIFMW